MISKFQSDEERTFMDRASSALKRSEEFLWILAYLLKNIPALRPVRHHTEYLIENNNDLIDDIEEAKDRESRESDEYRKSA